MTREELRAHLIRLATLDAGSFKRQAEIIARILDTFTPEVPA